jgi:diacylglycerol kinase
MKDQPVNFIAKRLSSFKHAFVGWLTALRTETNFQVHVIAAVGVIASGFYFEISPMEWMVVSIAIGGVLGMELVNAAIERLADLVQPEYDLRVKAIKDLAAGGVLIVACAAAVVGLFVFVPKIMHALNALV